MTKSRGREGERRLADMSEVPAARCYKPPPVPDPLIVPIDLSPTDRLCCRLNIYRGKIVDFAIMQITVVDEVEVHVARIDCCHGTIHRHQFDRNGLDTYDRRVIVEIPPDGGWGVVDQGYTAAYDVMFNEWEDNLRRWRGE